MTPDDLQARIARLDGIHKGFCEESRRFRLSGCPDEVIYSLALEAAAWQLAKAGAALHAIDVRGGLRVRSGD